MTEKFKKKKSTDIFSDISTNLTAHPDTKDLVRVTNNASVRRSIRNLVLTDSYERPFSSLGCNVRRMLFENITPQTTAEIENLITDAIENYEPRCKLIGVKATPRGNAYNIDIVYYTINNDEPQKLQFLLNRVR